MRAAAIGDDAAFSKWIRSQNRRRSRVSWLSGLLPAGSVALISRSDRPCPAAR